MTPALCRITSNQRPICLVEKLSGGILDGCQIGQIKPKKNEVLFSVFVGHIVDRRSSTVKNVLHCCFSLLLRATGDIDLATSMEKHPGQFKSDTRTTAGDDEHPAVERGNILLSEGRWRGEPRANHRNNASHVEHKSAMQNVYVEQYNRLSGDLAW